MRFPSIFYTFSPEKRILIFWIIIFIIHSSLFHFSVFLTHSHTLCFSLLVFVCSQLTNLKMLEAKLLSFHKEVGMFKTQKGFILDHFDDEYGGVIVNPEKLPSDSQLFASLLHSSVCQWRFKGKKGIWLKLPLEYSEYVPIAVKEGFEYHHAERGYVMLTYWLPEGPCLLPANASHQVGVGAFVMNDKNELLVVQERYCTPSTVGLWKIPTGFIHESEEIYTGVVREVKEETGVDAEFQEVIAFRHAQNMEFDKSDLFFICVLKPLSSEIKVDDHEIQAAKWMSLVEFVKQPLIKEDRMFMKVIDIFTERMRKKYCGLHPHELDSKFEGRSSTLYYNVLKVDDP